MTDQNTKSTGASSGGEAITSPRLAIPWWKKLLFFLIYCGALIFFFLIAAELVFRIFSLAPVIPPETQNMVADPFINHKPEPNSVNRGRHPLDGYEYEYRHNSLGFREREIPIEKPEGEFRILGIGDSFMYGAGVDEPNTILNQLKRRLNARAGDQPPVEVINMGISGFYPKAEGHVLEHYGLQFHPDLVIMNFYPNDIHETYVSKDDSIRAENGWLVSREAHRIGPAGVWLYVNVHLSRPLIRAWLAHFESTYLARLDADEILKDNGRYEESWRELQKDILHVKKMCDAAGAEFVLVNIPTFEFQDAKMDYPSRRLADWCAENAIHYIDTLEALRAAAQRSSEPLFWRHDIHTTPAGYEVLTSAIMEGLLAKTLVP